MTTKSAVALAVAVGAVGFAMPLLVHGAGAEGAVVAARQTARISAIFFSIALARRSEALAGPRMMYGFVAAHLVHFSSVAYVAVSDVNHPLHQLTPSSVTTMVLGGTLLAAVALTTEARAKWAQWLNNAAVYLVWALFTGAAILGALGIKGERHLPALVTLLPLLFALGYHLRNRTRNAATAVAANAS
jgi:hypothetical protein